MVTEVAVAGGREAGSLRDSNGTELNETAEAGGARDF